MSAELRDRIVAALAEEGSELRREGAALVVDHVLGLPIGELVDVESLGPLYAQALAADNVRRAVERHILPGIARVRSGLGAAGERVGDALPESAKATLIELSSNPAGPRFGWMRGALDPAKLRELIAPVVQETLLQFVRTVPGFGGSGGSSSGGATDEGGGGRGRSGRGVAAGLVGRLGREVQKNTGRLVSVGRSVADGMGVDLEGRLQETAREFSQGAMAGLQRGMRERLASPQGREILTGLARSIADQVFATPVEVIMKDLDRLPLEAAVGLAPEVIAHELARDVVRVAIDGEINAWLEVEGQRSLGDLLGEAGLLGPVRALAVERACRGSAALFSGDAFAAWLDRVLARSQ